MSTETTSSPAATMPAAFFGHGNPMNALVERIVSVTLTGQAPAELRLSWTVDTAARRTLETSVPWPGTPSYSRKRPRSMRTPDRSATWSGW